MLSPRPRTGQTRDVRIVANAVQRVTVHRTDPRPIDRTATFSVTLATRGPASTEGDITVSDGTTTFLVPFWFSNGS